MNEGVTGIVRNEDRRGSRVKGEGEDSGRGKGVRKGEEKCRLRNAKWNFGKTGRINKNEKKKKAFSYCFCIFQHDL